MPQDASAQLKRPGQSEGAATPPVAEIELVAPHSEHEHRPPISGWVRDHEHRSEEYRRAFKDLLKEEGFISSSTAS